MLGAGAGTVRVSKAAHSDQESRPPAPAGWLRVLQLRGAGQFICPVGNPKAFQGESWQPGLGLGRGPGLTAHPHTQRTHWPTPLPSVEDPHRPHYQSG